MPGQIRLAISALSLFCLLATGGAASSSTGQTPKPDGPPKTESEQKAKKRASLKLFALGKLHLREDKLLEALRSFEEAAALDPTAVLVQRELVSLYAIFNRQADALKTCRALVKLDPADAKTWYAYCRLLQRRGKNREAREVLEKAVQHIKSNDNLEIAQQIYYDLGLLQNESGKKAAAVISFGKCADLLQKAVETLPLQKQQTAQINLRRAGLFERIANNQIDLGRYKDALRAYEQAQKLDSAGANRYNLSLAKVHVAQGNHTEAIKHLDDYLRFRPQGSEAYKLKIKLLDKLNRSRETLPWLERVSAQDRYNYNLKMLLAREYGKRRQPKEAEKIYIKLVNENPKPETYSELFRLYRNSGVFGTSRVLDSINSAYKKVNNKDDFIAADKAKTQVRAMISALRHDKSLTGSLLQEALPRLERRSTLEYETVRLLAVLAEHNRKPQESIRFYRDLLRRNNRRSTEALVYSGLIRSLWKTKQYKEVIAVCDDGLRNTQATNHVLFHSEQARAMAVVGKLTAALKAVDEAVRVASDSSLLAMQRLRVRILIKAKQIALAEKECNELLKKNKQPGDILEIRYLLSHLYTTTKDFTKAENELQLVIDIDPVNATAHNDLGYLWADQGKHLEKAEKMIRRAIELDREQRRTITSASTDADQDKAAYLDSLGWVLFRRGKLAEARKELDKATKLPGGEDPVIWDHLGDVCFRLNDPVKARRCWQEALRLYKEGQTRTRDQRFLDLQEKIRQLDQISAPQKNNIK